MQAEVGRWPSAGQDLAERAVKAALLAAGDQARESLSGVATEIVREMGSQRGQLSKEMGRWMRHIRR